MASRKCRVPRFSVYQLGRGSEPVIVVGNMMSLVARNIFDSSCSSSGFEQWILKLPRLIGGRVENGLRSRPLELLEAASDDTLVLYHEDAVLLPLPIRAETDVAYDRAVVRLVDVVGHLGLVVP